MDQLLASRENKEDYSLIEDIKEIQEKRTARIISNYYFDITEESDKDLILAESDFSLERSIWALSKNRCEGKENIRVK